MSLLSTTNKELLNRYFGHLANKVQLGTLLEDALQVAVGELTAVGAGKMTIGAPTTGVATAIGPDEDYLNVARVARATYDFAEHAGAQGAIGLGVTLPDNAILTRVWYEVLTTFESGTDAATIALHAQSAGDIIVAKAISHGDDIWDAGRFDTIVDGTLAAFVKTDGAKELTLTVAGGEDLTAGKLVMFAEYVVSD